MDDEEPIRKALQRLMRSAGLDAISFASGADFLTSLEGSVPDCLILDLHMPGLNGFEVQTRLTQTHQALPVIVITGHDQPEGKTRVLAAGAAAYLRKPVDAEALLDAITSSITAAAETGRPRGAPHSNPG